LTFAKYDVSSGDLSAKASRSISQTGLLKVDRNSTLSAGADLTLNRVEKDGQQQDVYNDFGKTATMTAGKSLSVGGKSQSLVAEAKGGDMTLAKYDVTAGDLRATASQSIYQTGELNIVGTIVNIHAANNLVLNKKNVVTKAAELVANPKDKEGKK